MLNKLLKRLWREQKGITGLETAIILIAFVVVSSVLAYTVLSAGLFSTQKSQEAVHSGLKEAQSSMELKGGMVANGRATLNAADFVTWVADTDATLTRETTTKWEGSASLKTVIGALMAQNDEPIYRAFQPIDLTNGDTLTFWIKADAALDNNISFVLATGTDLSGTATQTYAINTSGTGWEKHTITLSGGNDDSAAYFGITLSTDAEGTFYLDKILFDTVASQGGIAVPLDSADYIGWVADTDATATRETTTKIEGNASLSVVIGALMAQDDEPVYHAMAAKDWTNGDTITFWIKAEAALDSKLTFHLATGTDLNGTSTESYLINTAGTGWEKHTVTLSGGDDDSAVYYGVSLSTDAEGTFYLDGLQLDAHLNVNSDPMKTYANQLVFTVANVLGGEPVDFSTTTDSDADGIISDETKTHKVVIHYNDLYQQVSDVAWSVSTIGNDDGDNLLEANEKFLVTVDLTYINNNAGWDFKQVDVYHPFTIEVKSPSGGIFNLERTMPSIIKDVNNLN